MWGANARLSHSADPRPTSSMSRSVSGTAVSASPGRNAPMVLTSTPGPGLADDPGDELRRRGGVADGEGRRRRVTKRTAGASHDRHLSAHGVNRPRGAAKLVAGCHVVLFDQAIDGPGVARRQVRGHHRIVVIPRAGTTQDGTGAARAGECSRTEGSRVV
jgi:hypothetical protein